MVATCCNLEKRYQVLGRFYIRLDGLIRLFDKAIPCVVLRLPILHKSNRATSHIEPIQKNSTNMYGEYACFIECLSNTIVEELDQGLATPLGCKVLFVPSG